MFDVNPDSEEVLEKHLQQNKAEGEDPHLVYFDQPEGTDSASEQHTSPLIQEIEQPQKEHAHSKRYTKKKLKKLRRALNVKKLA